MLIPDYIAISVLVVSALRAGVKRFPRGKRSISPILLATMRRSEAALICVRPKRRSDDARSVSAWRHLTSAARVRA